MEYANYEPFLRYKGAVTSITRTWATTGNTDTVTNVNVHSNSVVVVNPVASQPAGLWKIVVSEGQFVVTSTDSEANTLTYNYLVL